jgi:uncharacterized membrane protein (DUF485 family)
VSDPTPGAAGHQPGSHTHAQYHDPLYKSLAESDDFQELRRRYRAFVFPWTAAFLAWYLLYVLLSNYAHGFMSTKLVGNINLGLVLGLLQFLSTFLIAWHYSKQAGLRFDPLAAKLKAAYEKGDHS